jgi:O-antigen/teichoic acid export membrane protein
MKISALWKYVSMAEIKAVLFKYREFPLKSGAGIFLNILKEQIPIFLLGYYFDAVVVGFYVLIIRLFGVPLSLLAGSIGQVYYQKAVEMNNDGKSLFPMYSKTTLRMLAFLIIPVAAVMIWGGDIFGFVFGADWIEAGKILVIFTIYYAIRFIISSQSSLLLVFKKLGIELGFNFIALVLQLGSLIIGALQNDYYLSLYLMSISGSVIYALLGIYLWVYLKTKK